MISWFDIHQSETVRQRLREAEESRLAAIARQSRRARVEHRHVVPRVSSRTLRASLGSTFGGFVGRLAGR